MSTSEIAKLESRWRDNPQGLTFAPLAEAYRKQKDPRRALEILLPGLERHPDYIPANIVLGRCHWDLSDLEAAETAFTHVLALDAENVIALKALADINERQSRPREAERWLETLLSVDRSNEEARDQLARIRAVQSVSPVLETPAGLEAPALQAEPAALPSEPEPSFMAGLRAPLDTEPVEPEPAEPGPDLVTAEAASSFSDSPDPFPAIADQLRPQENRESEDAGSPWAAASATELEPAPFPDLGDFPEEPGVPKAGSIEPPPAPVPTEALGFERPEEIVLHVSGGSEFHSPSAAEELVSTVEPDAAPFEAAAAAVEATPAPSDTLADEPPPAAALFGSYLPDATSASYEPPPLEAPAPKAPQYEAPVAESVPAGEPSTPPGLEPAAARGAVDSPDIAEPDLVVTETMAQVFLRQGHVVEALAVYRELATREPAAHHLHARIAELETRQAAAMSPPRPSLLARDTGGQSLGSLFAGVLAARLQPLPALEDESQDGGTVPESAPATRPAEEPLSLGSVFGEDPPAAAPAVPPGGASPAESAGDAGGPAVSFDEFFAGSPVATPGPAPVPRPSRPKSDDDLDQFHSWLQSLKR
jgi:tetratricopeptide (TPR) repeat protein